MTIPRDIALVSGFILMTAREHHIRRAAWTSTPK